MNRRCLDLCSTGKNFATIGNFLPLKKIRLLDDERQAHSILYTKTSFEQFLRIKRAYDLFEFLTETTELLIFLDFLKLISTFSKS